MATARGGVQRAFTGESYDTPIGIVTGGEWGDDTSSKVVTGIGGTGVVIPGPQTTLAKLNVVPVNNACLLDKVLRTSYPAGLPTAFPLAVGDSTGSRTASAWYIDTAEMELKVGDALAVSYGVAAFPGKPTTTALSGAWAPPKTPLMWLEGKVWLDGADCDAESCKISVKNDVLAQFSLNAKTDGSRRHPDGGDSGAEKVEADIVFFTDPGHDLLGDDLDTATIILQAANQATSPTTYTFTAAGGKATTYKSSLVDGDARRMYTVHYQYDYNLATITSVLS
jgi:hypothetical protein